MDNLPNSDKTSRRDFLKTSAQVSLAASLYATWGCAPTGNGGPKPPNVLLLSLDTTRADHMASYGYPRLTSPNLDALAENGILFKNAISTSSWTLPAHASMFTGKFVTTHGARKSPEGTLSLDEAFDGGDTWNRYSVDTIRQEETLLAEVLRDAGYATGAVVAGPWLKKAFGLHRGFDYFNDDDILGFEEQQKRLGTEITRHALRWLKSTGDRPYFLFLNYFDPHLPYSLPEDFQHQFDGTPDPGLHPRDELVYDREIFFMDHCIGELFDGMKKRDVFDNTLIVAIGDHGEAFGSHGYTGHGRNLYQEEIHVPLIVRYPMGEVAAATRDEYIQPIDLVPLILNRLELPLPEGVQGSPVEMISHPILAEVYPHAKESPQGQWQCLIENGKKLMVSSLGNHKLFDLIADPREANDLAASDPDLLSDMMAKLLTHFDALPRPEGAPPPLSVDDATLKELESMGYL